jgi:ATP-binding cassette subfamily B protein
MGEVVFDNVSFHYNGSTESRVLENVNLTVEAGQRIAVLGATGSGKTSLLNLIPRFYDVAEGRVLVDGIDVRQVSEHSLRSQIGFVMQQTTLFSGTVAENIAYGHPNASMDQITAAAKAAQAHDFIMSMPKGYQSQVEARGANLSGGQKQRIAIARALLIDPAILILDDSTSSVDMETEFRIQEALDDLMDGRTTFIIAQRISSVLNADKIIILECGEIVAQGTHRQLIDTSPIYQEIYCSQLRDDIPLDEAASCKEPVQEGI